MNELLPLALDIVRATSALDHAGVELPFGLKTEENVEYAKSQFQKRWVRIEKARRQTLEELYQLSEVEEGTE